MGSAASGSKQGAQRSPTAQPAVGRSAACAATNGRHVDKQRPSAPAIEVHELGTEVFAVAMMESGAQMPAPSSQLANSDCWACGTSELAAQCAPAHAGEHAGREDGSMIGGPE